MVKTHWRIEMSKFFSETGSGFEGLGGIAVPKLPLNAPPGRSRGGAASSPYF